MSDIHIRRFELKDRADVRRISCETSFLEKDRRLFIDDDEILADALTLYYTDHEPGSCFVAVADGRVVGYITGTKDVSRMDRVSSKRIVPRLIRKALRRGLFLKMRTWQFFFNIAASGLKGEFHAPHFCAQYPAMLHINIDNGYRGRQLGTKLMGHYLDFLKEQGLAGLHFGTMSEDAKAFFLKSGFDLLHASKRSYLKFRTGEVVPFYIFGKDLKKGL